MDRILLRFSEENVAEPITSQVILELGIPMRIVTATVNSLGGDILLEVPAVHVDKIVKAFKAKGVVVKFPKLIEVDSDKCFDCGACYALCPVDAISYDEGVFCGLRRENLYRQSLWIVCRCLSSPSHNAC